MWLLAGALAAGCASAPPAPAPEAQSFLRPVPEGALHVQIDHPAQPWTTREREAVVLGRVWIRSDRFDVVIVVDTSESTSDSSGLDADRDGRVEKTLRLPHFLSWLPEPRQSGDSVLEAQLVAARTLLGQLDPERTRAALVAFSGDRNATTPDARTLVPLTADHHLIADGLALLEVAGPSGLTNMAAALGEATKALDAGQAPEVHRIIVFLTDGIATLPFQGYPEQNVELALRRAGAAGRAGVRIYTFPLGRMSVERSVVAVEAARATNGVVTPVIDPWMLPSHMQRLHLSPIDGLELTNAATNEITRDVVVGADGSFAALVRLQEGANPIEVEVSSGPAQARAKIAIQRVANAPAHAPSPRVAAARARLLDLRAEEAPSP